MDYIDKLELQTEKIEEIETLEKHTIINDTTISVNKYNGHAREFLAIDGDYNDGFNQLKETNGLGISCNVSKEVKEARKDINGVYHEKLKDRIDSEVNKIKTSLDNINKQINGVFNTLSFEKLPNENNDSGRIQRAIDYITSIGGGTLVSNENLLINSTVVIKDNVNIDFVNVKNSEYLVTFFETTKNNVIKVNIECNKDLVDETTAYRGITISNNSDNIIIKNSFIKNCYWGICSNNAEFNNVIIENNTFENLKQDIYCDNVVGSNLQIKNNNFIGDKLTLTPFTSFGEIFICCGYNFTNVITDEIIINKKFKNILVENNKIDYSNHRPIFVTNGKNVTYKGNYIGGRVGNKTSIGCSDDTLIVDLCDGFLIEDNFVGASGENGIDILSSINGVVRGNNINKVDDYGIVFDISDRFMEGKAILSDNYLIPKNVKVINNSFEGRELSIGISLASHILFDGNYCSNHGTGTNGIVYTLENPTLTSWISDNVSRKIGHLYFRNNFKENLYKSAFRQNNRDLVEQGTIHLQPDFGVVGYIELMNSNEQKAFVHNVGKYNNVKIEVEINGVYYETRGVSTDKSQNIRGITPYHYDINQVIVASGDYLVNVRHGEMNKITSGKIRLTVY